MYESVQIKIIKSYSGAEGYVKPGEIHPVSDDRGKELIRAGLAVEHDGKEKSASDSAQRPAASGQTPVTPQAPKKLAG